MALNCWANRSTYQTMVRSVPSGDNEVARNSGARSSINRSDLKTEEMKIQAEVEECTLANCEVTHFWECKQEKWYFTPTTLQKHHFSDKPVNKDDIPVLGNLLEHHWPHKRLMPASWKRRKMSQWSRIIYQICLPQKPWQQQDLNCTVHWILQCRTDPACAAGHTADQPSSIQKTNTLGYNEKICSHFAQTTLLSI